MFPFDSPIDTQALLIPVILLLYAVILLRLKPSEDDRSQPNSVSTEAQRLHGSEMPRNSVPVAKVRRIASQSPSNSEIYVAPTQITENNVQNQEIEAKPDTELDEQTRERQKKKSFFLFGEQDFGGCRHKPGYLITVPRNTPIPEECFGCPEILECMKYKTR